MSPEDDLNFRLIAAEERINSLLEAGVKAERRILRLELITAALNAVLNMLHPELEAEGEKAVAELDPALRESIEKMLGL